MSLLNIFIWLLFGALVGWIASLIMGTNRTQGIIMDIVLGLLGAVVGGLLASLFGSTGITGFNLYSFLIALAGAVVLVWAGRRLA